MRILAFGIFFIFLSNSSFCQYELDKADDCKYVVEQDYGNLVIATGSSDCQVFKNAIIKKNHTLIVFDTLNREKVLYQVTIENGLKEGVELLHTEGERTINTFHKGIPIGESYIYYDSGEVHYLRKFRKGKLKKKILEYNRKGEVIKTHIAEK